MWMWGPARQVCWPLLTFLLLLIIRMPGMQFYLRGWRRSENTPWITLPRGEGVQDIHSSVSHCCCWARVSCLVISVSNVLTITLYSPHSPLIRQHLRISPDGNPAFSDVNSNSDSADGAASWMWQLFVCNNTIYYKKEWYKKHRWRSLNFVIYCSIVNNSCRWIFN